LNGPSNLPTYRKPSGAKSAHERLLIRFDLIGASFRTNNTQATLSCACGMSFSL